MCDSMHDFRSRPSIYLVTLGGWAVSVVLFSAVIIVADGPLWLIPLGILLISAGVERSWRRYRQYAPWAGLYLMLTWLLGYAFVNHIGRYTIVGWTVWLIVTYMPLFWLSRHIPTVKNA